MKTVIEIVADSLGLEPEEVSGEQSFDELGIDSLEAMHICHKIEQEYKVKIAHQERASFKLVQHLLHAARTA